MSIASRDASNREAHASLMHGTNFCATPLNGQHSNKERTKTKERPIKLKWPYHRSVLIPRYTPTVDRIGYRSIRKIPSSDLYVRNFPADPAQSDSADHFPSTFRVSVIFSIFHITANLNRRMQISESLISVLRFLR